MSGGNFVPTAFSFPSSPSRSASPGPLPALDLETRGGAPAAGAQGAPSGGAWPPRSLGDARNLDLLFQSIQPADGGQYQPAARSASLGHASANAVAASEDDDDDDDTAGADSDTGSARAPWRMSYSTSLLPDAPRELLAQQSGRDAASAVHSSSAGNVSLHRSGSETSLSRLLADGDGGDFMSSRDNRSRRGSGSGGGSGGGRHHKKVLGLRRRHWLILTSIVFHILCFAGIREVYFRSVLVPDVPVTPWGAIGPVESPPGAVPPLPASAADEDWERPPSDAVFVFCISSLRFDKLTLEREAGRPVAGYLKRQIEHGNAAWAMSLARAPTETRPGHGALMAGIYEDPGIFGATLNWDSYLQPVDSLFSHVDTAAYAVTTHRQSYRSVIEALVDKPGVHLLLGDVPSGGAVVDEHTVRAVERFLRSVECQQSAARLAHRRQQPKNSDNEKQGMLVWTELLGLDAHMEPLSERYLAELTLIDQRIERMVAQIEAALPALRKTFVVTSDHGLMDSGLHGDEKKQNSYTPFIAWGAGVASSSRRPADSDASNDSKNDADQPDVAGQAAVASAASGDVSQAGAVAAVAAAVAATTSVSIDPDQLRLAEYYRVVSNQPDAHWKLEHLQLSSFNQVDIPALLSCLLGAPLPTVNLGIVPLELLNASAAYVAKSMLVNTKQIHALYDYKLRVKEARTSLFLRYAPLYDVNKGFVKIEGLIRSGQFDVAAAEAHHLALVVLYGIEYLDSYDRYFSLLVILVAYVGWIFCVVGELAPSRIRLANAETAVLRRRGVDPSLSQQSSTPLYNLLDAPASPDVSSSQAAAAASSSSSSSKHYYDKWIYAVTALLCVYIYFRNTLPVFEYFYALCAMVFWRDVLRSRARLYRVLLLASYTTTPTCSAITVPQLDGKSGSLSSAYSSSTGSLHEHERDDSMVHFHGPSITTDAWMGNIVTLPSLFLLVLLILALSYSFRPPLAVLYFIIGLGSSLFLHNIDNTVRRNWSLSCCVMGGWLLVSDYAPATLAAQLLSVVAMIAWSVHRTYASTKRSRGASVALHCLLSLLVLYATLHPELVNDSPDHYAFCIATYLLAVLAASVLPFWLSGHSLPSLAVDEFISLLALPLLLISIAHRTCFFFLLAENMTWWYFIEQQLKRSHLSSSMYSPSSVAHAVADPEHHGAEPPQHHSGRLSNSFVSTETKAQVRVAFAFLFFESVALIGPRSIASIAAIFLPPTTQPWRHFTYFPAWYYFNPESWIMPRVLFSLQLVIPMLFVAFVFVLVLGSVWTNFQPLRLLVFAICWSDIMSMFSLLFINPATTWEKVVMSIVRYTLQSFLLCVVLTPLAFFASSVLSYRRLKPANR